MAIIGEIRKRSGLLLAVIGIAMVSFILGDLLKSSSPNSGNSVNAGEVLGEDILIYVFNNKVEEGIDNWQAQNPQGVLNQSTMVQIRNDIWDQYIKELVMENEFEKLGIAISDEEWLERISGMNVHSEISKVPAFQDQNTSEFDRTKILAYLQQIDQDQTGEARSRWLDFEKYLLGQIKTSKYNSLVGKGIYTTNSEAQTGFNHQNQEATFNYVAIPFTSIQDSDITVTDKEINAYYEDHKYEYKQENSKDVDFVVFTAVPSAEDDAAVREDITYLAAEFETYENYDLMARRNSDNTNSKFVYAVKNSLQDPQWEELFDAEKGKVIGPYLASPGVYRIAKLAEIEYRSDSVEARHILISPTNQMSLDSVNKKIDNLKLSIENGADFGTLARKNSEDQGSAIKGGDLGWFSEGVMVDQFNEACFGSDLGDLSVVTSQFGVHLVQVTKASKKVKKVKIAYIDRSVDPSPETFTSYFSQAAKFAGKILNDGINFDTLVGKNNLVKRSDSRVTEDKPSIAGLPNSREMVRWLHNNAEVGDLSEVYEFDNSYVVAYVTKEHEEGVQPLDDIREEIISLVIKEKKASKIIEGITNSDLESIANEGGVSIVNNKKSKFANSSIQGIGYDPELLGAIFANKVGVVSSPIVGKSAVYVIQLTSIDDYQLEGDFLQQKLQIQRQASSYSNIAAYDVLKEAADVIDNRVNFY